MSAPRPAKVGPYRPDAGLPVTAMLAVSESRGALRREAERVLAPHLLNLGSVRRTGSVQGYVTALEETLQAALELLGLEP